MREFEHNIVEALKAGLSPFKITPFNSPYLLQCYGLRLGKDGLEKYEEKTNPLPGTVDLYYEWPFPQYITGEKYNILVVRDLILGEDTVYTVSDDHTIVTAAFQIDNATYGQGTLLEVADFGEYAVMVNGAIIIYRDVAAGTWSGSVASGTFPLLTTICNLNGQAVGGGVKSTWYNCDETYYVWSAIGYMDFTLRNDNEAGYRRCPYGGTVYHVRELDGKAVGYSSKGVILIYPVSDPAITFGFKRIDDSGLINQGAMCSDYNGEKHIYVDKNLMVKELTPGGMKELGYQVYMDEIDDEDIIVTYDKLNKDFYIGNSIKTYLLTPFGLTEVPQHPSAVWSQDENVYMLPATVDTDYKVLISPQPFDFGYAGQKTTFGVETDLLLADSPEASISYYTNILTYGTTGYFPLNDQNVVSIIASGNAFTVNLRYTPTYDNTRIGYIKVRWKMTDLRGIRGVYAAPPRGQ